MRKPLRASLRRRYWRHRVDLILMREMRADYYTYLSDLLVAQRGKRSLRDVFADDARRHGSGTARGRSSAHWARAFEMSGGQLSQTWDGFFPAADLALIQMAQHEGAAALSVALRDLAHMTQLMQALRRILVVTMGAGLVALLALIGVLLITAHITVPRLLDVFAGVSPALWSAGTRNLVAFAQATATGLPLILIATVAVICGVQRALPRLTGAWRSRMDRWFVFRLYRQFHAIRFICLLGLLVRDRQQLDIRLRDALVVIAESASGWMRQHLNTMVARLDDGLRDSTVFDTGLLDASLFWFMSDVIAARGLSEGLAHARVRIETQLVRSVTTQAMGLRWLLLLGSVGGVLGVALWHMQVVDALRRALALGMVSG